MKLSSLVSVRSSEQSHSIPVLKVVRTLEGISKSRLKIRTPVRANTPADRKLPKPTLHKPIFQISSSSAKQFQTLEKQIRSNLLVKDSQHFLKSMHQIQSESQHILHRGNHGDMSYERTTKKKKQGFFKVKPETSQMLVLQSNNRKWLKRRGIDESSNAVKKFIYELFDMLDEDKKHFVSGEKLLETLVGLGVTSEFKVLENSLKLLLRTNDLSNLKIKKSDLQSLFKTDFLTKCILELLNSSCLEKLHKNKEITISDHLEVITKWWNGLQKDEFGRAELNEIVNKLESIQPMPSEFRSYIKSQTNGKKSLKFIEYEQLFARSMIEGALHNLTKRLNKGGYQRHISPSLRLSEYNRSLFLSGVKCPNSKIAFEEGASALKATGQYLTERNRSVEKLPFEEFRANLLKLAGVDESNSLKNFRELYKKIYKQ